jgi:hypothetical protein
VDAFTCPVPDDPLPGVDVKEWVDVGDRVGLAESVAVDVRERVGLAERVAERERVEDADGGSGNDT